MHKAWKRDVVLCLANHAACLENGGCRPRYPYIVSFNIHVPAAASAAGSLSAKDACGASETVALIVHGGNHVLDAIRGKCRYSSPTDSSCITYTPATPDASSLCRAVYVIYLLAVSRPLCTAHSFTTGAAMPQSTDVCGACTAPTARQPFVVGCGQCLRQFHCKCVGIKDEDHDLVVGTFKCFTCTRRHDPERAAVLGGSGTALVEKNAQDQLPLSVQSKKGLLCRKIDSAAAELRSFSGGNEVLCCPLDRKNVEDRQLPVPRAGKGVVCVGQGESAPRDDRELHRQVALLRRDVDALTSDVRLLNSESELFRLHLARTTEVLGKIALGLEEKRPPSLPIAAVSPKTYAAALRGDARHCVGGTVTERPSSARELSPIRSEPEPSHEESRHDSPALRKASRRSSAAQNFRKPGGLAAARRGRKLQSSVGTCPNSKLLSAAPKRTARRALFVSRLHPSTTSKSVSDFVNGVTGGARSCVCTKLPSKHDTYSSFHVAVDETDFDGLLRAELWPAGCLFRPFYGALKEGGGSATDIAMTEKSP
ncbi:hypothetical protein HPB49_010666 [Dermacentor silvarum]|uniref:Uncharacterized protein n=1 Tax=Dermacentor silvarum TaxID=543639 RepID=A0ACB8CEJ1_DERSI|nr:hypothetical protein HPB49_010666 [Dermacentor silvarum]